MSIARRTPLRRRISARFHRVAVTFLDTVEGFVERNTWSRVVERTSNTRPDCGKPLCILAARYHGRAGTQQRLLDVLVHELGSEDHDRPDDRINDQCDNDLHDILSCPPVGRSQRRRLAGTL
jgi:hypothetical protein